MTPFVYAALPARAVFGRGRIPEAAREARRPGIRRPLVIATARQAEQGRAILAATGGAAFAGAAMHAPVSVAGKAMALVLAEGCVGAIAPGGGSSTGRGKAADIAASKSLSQSASARARRDPRAARGCIRRAKARRLTRG